MIHSPAPTLDSPADANAERAGFRSARPLGTEPPPAERVTFVGTELLTPVFRHFSGRPFHKHTVQVDWAIDEVMNELKAHLIYSEAHHRCGDPSAATVTYSDMLFRLPGEVFLYLHRVKGHAVEVYAGCPETAAKVLGDLNTRFTKPPPPETSKFFQLCTSGFGGIDRLEISLKRAWLQSPADLALHYGAEFAGWEQNLVERLQTQTSGLTILRGEPGVGKTCFVRHLLSRLAKTHRCFVVPTSNFGLLADPQLANFWANEATRSKLHSLLILEDAEALLEKRRGPNNEMVSNLLNMADGLLGDAMRVQIVATVNAPLDKLDPAVTRRGRLQAYHQFRRLTREEAGRLAKAKGITLPEQPDYTLADIFTAGQPGTGVPQEASIGFR